MNLKRMWKAKRNALSYLLSAVMLFGSGALIQADLRPAEAQEANDDGPPPPPRHGDDDREGPGPRGEFRRKFRDEMKERMRGEPGEAGPRGSGGGRIGRFLEVVQSFQNAVQDPHQAVGLAALGVKEHYRRVGKPLDAIKELDELLAQASDQKMRNIFLFVEKQIYEEEKMSDKFLELSRRIMKENMGLKK